MNRKVVATLIGLAIPIAVFSYIGYVDMTIRAASDLQWERQYEQSARRLEGLLPYVWTELYRGQIMLKLAFNYRWAGDYTKMRAMGVQMAEEYPDTLWGYYGLRFQADYLREVEGDCAHAIDLYKQILDQAKPRSQDDALHGLTEAVLFELVSTYHQTGQADEMQAVIERLRSEYPESSYLEKVGELK